MVSKIWWKSVADIDNWKKLRKSDHGNEKTILTYIFKNY
jgi:hypothetical protein